MEELEINPEGEAPQQPDAASLEHSEGASPHQSDVASPHQSDAAGPEQPEAESPDHVDPLSAPEPEATTGPASEAAAAPETASPEAPAPDPPVPAPAAIEPDAAVPVEELLVPETEAPAAAPMEDVQLMAVLEAVVYVAEEPLTLAQIANAIRQPPEHVDAVLRRLIAELEKPEHGIAIREVAGGFKMATKAEHHEAVRNFVKSLKPPMKLSLPALETLAVIAYKQPVTAPEIMEIRGVQGAGVLKTLLDRKLIAVAGRKNVIGKPILYKTTRDFLIQFGLNDVSELPSLKEFEEIRRMAFADSEPAAPEPQSAPPETTPDPAPGVIPEQEP
jgi:segregation and condensation protein B